MYFQASSEDVDRQKEREKLLQTRFRDLTLDVDKLNEDIRGLELDVQNKQDLEDENEQSFE